MRFLTCLCLFVVLATPPIGAGERLTMKVSPAVAFAPVTLFVRTFVASDASNRSIEIIAESPDFYRSSEAQLDGARAPRTHMVEFRSLPSGLYSVSAVLRGANNEERALVTQQVNVMSLD
jgi:hypothetical protein